MSAPQSSRKRLYIAVVVGVIVVGAVAGFVGLKGASSDIDPTKVVVAESGTMVKSVVATGKIEPTTKIEIKSKANGIIEALPVDVDRQRFDDAIRLRLDFDFGRRLDLSGGHDRLDHRAAFSNDDLGRIDVRGRALETDETGDRADDDDADNHGDIETFAGRLRR